MPEPKALEDFLNGEIVIRCDTIEEKITFQETLAEKGVLWASGESTAKYISTYPHDAYRIGAHQSDDGGLIRLLYTTRAKYEMIHGKNVVSYSDVFPKPTIQIPDILKNTIKEIWNEIDEV
ncbi:MAG: hypothetical protein ACI4KR_00390 [Ruminiclostridium sp.]